jgi:small subunit ribosomal protein S17
MSETGLTQAAARARTPARRARRVRVGIVESDQRDKTIKVRIDWLSKHAKYGKYLRYRTILHAHDEANEAHVGDTVEIMECRPVSKTKSWRLTRIIRKHAEG